MNPLIADRDRFAADHPESTVTIRGRQWGVTDLPGEGPALLLVPGTLGRGDVFWRVMQGLRGRVRMIACTYPATFDLANWAEDISRLLDRADLDRVTILGSSLGGYLAQFFAGTYPERCTSLIAANTLVSATEVATRPPYSGDLARTPIATLRAGFAGGLRTWAQTHPDQADLVELLLAEVGGRIPARHLRARLMALKHAPDLPPLGMPSARIAVIEAADDPLIPKPMRDAVRARLDPQVTFRFLSGGHFPYIARPDLYVAALEDWLGISAGPSAWGEGRLRCQ